MKNIDLFDEYVAVIFATLYEGFPVKRAVDARKISGHSDIDDFGGVVDAAGNRSRNFEIAFATIEWLVETGYIRAEDRHQFGYSRAVLTASALEVLKASPASLSAKEPVGERIVRFVKEGSLGLAKEAAKAAISHGIGLIR